MTYLTKEEIYALPVGTKISVIWSGGNRGNYKIAGKRSDGTPYVNNCYEDNLEFLGTESPFTRVRVAD